MNRRLALASLSADERAVVVKASLKLAEIKGAVLPLLRMLQHEFRPMNRHAILYALSWHSEPRAWWPFLRILADRNETPLVRGQAAEGIAYHFEERRRRPKSLGYLVALDVLTWALNDPSAEVLYYALFAIGASKDSTMLPILEPLTTDPTRSADFPGTLGQEARDAIEWIVGLGPATPEDDGAPS